MKVHMWAARRPPSFHRGKLTRLTSPLWNTVISLSGAGKPKGYYVGYYTSVTWSHKGASVTQMLISSIGSGLPWIQGSHVPALLTSPPVVTLNIVVTPLPLLTQKPLRSQSRSSGFDFTCFDGSRCIRGGLSIPGELLRGHLFPYTSIPSFQLGGRADITLPSAAREA